MHFEGVIQIGRNHDWKEQSWNLLIRTEKHFLLNDGEKNRVTLYLFWKEKYFFCTDSTKKRIFVKKFTHTQSNIIVVMNYPSVSEYIDALSCASDNFATLTSLTLILDSNG